MMIEQLNAEIKWVHSGQYYPYGDTYRVAEITCVNELAEATILKLCHNNGKLRKDVFYNSNLNMSEYFRGYYTIEKTRYGYTYIGVEPYTG